MEIEKAAFMTRSADSMYECLRSAAGLGVENIQVDVYLIGLDLPPDGIDVEIDELVEMIDDLEGRVFPRATMAGVVESANNYDLIIPF